ncbi:MAG: hypothetical protein COW19_03370 [Zetaproteobacteria bacterium CG12_big_fil_rev_8_21_14_0_65_55_1124]|nr:MAG: hypothetical protein AUJ58_00385 [Zetaproteobacteria bacterium CG1_02_55_237]PIW43385.1 MAG: hypothetical protein COW19_03370 [Zetaproteobacteria bacterium CG12_big_fil_rev_8_21_14_0_65_55_1124]PIY53092.1 MAG: hypothetical protein COZ01_05275 [Zetaproteobacteria bacterium CG_4_10_14_0_8_um_filter_55_43]PIZ40001.1 MAG: hypothetical protein COY36_01225 [Zetaproteobacteria bacterium CG_4_10_14_0_2_um_filter_55_20]PJB81287.1 MAG: hypothetical protein CO089_05060 [Zetaproteobacteria bacteriu
MTLSRLPVLLLLVLAACRPMVGGPCSYDAYPGTVEVVAVFLDEYQLVFGLLPGAAAGHHAHTFVPLDRLNVWQFPADIHDAKLAGTRVGDCFQAVARVMTKGSCTPVIIDIGEPCTKH